MNSTSCLILQTDDYWLLSLLSQHCRNIWLGTLGWVWMCEVFYPIYPILTASKHPWPLAWSGPAAAPAHICPPWVNIQHWTSDCNHRSSAKNMLILHLHVIYIFQVCIGKLSSDPVEWKRVFKLNTQKLRNNINIWVIESFSKWKILFPQIASWACMDTVCSICWLQCSDYYWDESRASWFIMFK